MELTPDARRWAGLAAVVGGVVGLLYWPLHSLAYFATESGSDSEGLLKPTEWLREPLEPLLDWSSPDTVYVTYGKIIIVPAAGFLLGLVAVRAALPAVTARLVRWGFRISIVGNVLVLVGLVIEYWLELVDLGFAIDFPAFLILLAGSTMLGIGMLRERSAPRVGAWLLALAIPLVLGCTLLIGHLSAGLIPLDLAWIVLGWWAWSDGRAHVPRGRPLLPEG
jgi:hypothetical protein